MMKTTLSVLLIVLVCGMPSVVLAEASSLDPAATTVTERAASDGTTYYSVGITLPENLTRVSHAWLELHADVSARNLNGFIDPAPVFEVYALNQTLSGDPEPSRFVATRLPMSRPVATGTGRLVKIDITEFVQSILADPSKNHGLVIGPLTDDKRGIFTVRQDSFGPGISARLVIK